MAYVKNGVIHVPAFYADAPYNGEHERNDMYGKLKRIILKELKAEGYVPLCFDFRMTRIEDEGDNWVMLAEPHQFQSYWHNIPGRRG